jgi:replicative DNA helicase
MAADLAPTMVGLGMRQPPANLRAEQALLGGILANNKALDRVSEFLAADHFADPCNAAVYAAILRRAEAGKVADVISLRPEFDASGALNDVGGGAYLAQLLSAMVSTRNAEEYGRLVHDAWLRRQLITACTETVERALASDADGTAPAVLEAHEAALTSLADRNARAEAGPGRDVAREVVETMMKAIERRGRLAGLTTGYAGLDRMTGGLMPGQLVILGARPSMGKTALAGAIAARAARAGGQVYFWGGEMMRSAVMARVVAATAGQPLEAVTRGALLVGENLEPLDYPSPIVDALFEAAREVGNLPVVWDDQPALAVASLRQRLRRRKRRHGLDLAVIDYLGLLRGSPDARRQGRYAEMSEISRSLKAIAMELQIPILACAQLNRANETRENKRPQLSDLRDSGEIEQDADMVMFLHREHYYLINNKPIQGKLSDEKYYESLQQWQNACDREGGRGELIIAKQRQGRTGPVRLRWEASMTWYFDESERSDAGALPGEG